MTDSHVSRLERRWGATGAPEDEVALWEARARAGLLSGDEVLDLQELRLRAGLLSPTPYPLPRVMPPCDPGTDLAWFLHKATFSCKALDALGACQDAVVERRSIRIARALDESYEETLAAALPPLPPHRTPQPWLDQARSFGLLSERVLVGPGLRHPRERYDNWTDTPCPEPADLLHDAVVFCWHRWSGEVLVRLTRALMRPVVRDGWTRFNTLDLVAAQMFSLAAWSWEGGR